MSDSQKYLGRIALVGAPNSGKTTLYNWLTGSHAKAVNYPGSTVDYMKGELSNHWNAKADVIDTPGAYSLQAKSEDESVTKTILTDPKFSLHPDKVVVVLDGTQIQRHLLLADQVKNLGLPMVIAVTMADLLSSKGVQINPKPLEDYFNCPVVLIDGRLGGGLQDLIRSFEAPSVSTGFKNFVTMSAEEIENKNKWAEKLAEEILPASQAQMSALWNKTLNWDQVLLHPWLGFVLFVLIMGALFSSIYWLATPLMDLVEGLFASAAETVLAWNSESLIFDFVANGIIASFGAVLVFVPQIFILFLGFGFLESSGYLARAATIVDKPFSLLGLSGRSFVPFLSGYACAVPALMAARNITTSRERWIARMIIPLLSCSARLPVYGLLLAFVYRGESSLKPGFILAGIYLLSMLVSAMAAGVLHKIMPVDKKSFFLMELPLYRKPILRMLLLQAWMKTKSFITNAGPVIFVLTVILWVGITFPNYKAEESIKVQTSYLGQAGQFIEPVFKPMGLDWRGGVGLMSAFAAREVFVSTLAVVYNVSENDGDKGLISAMQEAKFSDGTPIFTTAVVWGLIIFFMIALQCLSTVGVMIRESGSWKLAMIQLVSFNVLGYVLAVAVVQGLRAFGVG